MNSSPKAGLVPLAVPELRTGEWTRFGTSSVLGDTVTEQTLSALAESTRVAAGSQGYAVGWAEGQRAAREHARIEAVEAERVRANAEMLRVAEHDDAIAALERAAAALHEAVAGICDRVEESASRLAWDLVSELVGHEARTTGVDVVSRVLALLPTEPLVRVRLSPADAAAAGALTEHGAVVVADESLAPGDALVEADDHVLDLRLSTALDRVRAALCDEVGR
ncbi:MAG TPA: FliH/SctL family protein [Marmoricola sp.]|jgi:flagellar assembly protein FliH|nr:FliH/SctL family protein [Marmoricola sp.]